MANVTYTFKDMNNVDDPLAVGTPVPKIRELVYTEVSRLVNVDPGNDNFARLRKGTALRLAGNYTSMFANDNTFLVVEGLGLKRFWPTTNTTTLLKNLTSGAPMAFADTPIGVFFTNGSDIGMVANDVAESMPIPDTTVFFDDVSVPSYKVPVPPGQFVQWFNGTLFTLAFEDGASWLYHTDGYALEVDERENYFQFPGVPKMLIAIDPGGLFVSCGEKTVYLRGDGADSFQETPIAPYPAIPHTAIVCKAEQFNIEGISGEVAIWASTRGICLGTSDGQLINLSQGKVSYQPGKTGAAIIRELNGDIHYVLSMQDTEKEYNAYIPRNITVG